METRFWLTSLESIRPWDARPDELLSELAPAPTNCESAAILSGFRKRVKCFAAYFTGKED